MSTMPTPAALIYSMRGKTVDLGDPKFTPADLVTIGQALAKINRWGGMTDLPYSVAQHSVLVADIVHRLTEHASCDEARRKCELLGLLHDAHEVFLGEIPAPGKAAIEIESLFPSPMRLVANRLDLAILSAAGIMDPESMIGSMHSDFVYEADQLAKRIEARDLFSSDMSAHFEPVGDLWPQRLSPLTWDRAEDRFISRLRGLMNVFPYGE